jgi:hypothetical protein
MTDKEKVLAAWPDVVVMIGWDSLYRVWSHGGDSHGIIGTGNTEAEAWADAASRLAK